MPKKENNVVIDEEKEIDKIRKSDTNYTEYAVLSEKEKRKYLNYLKPVYAEVGINLTDEDIEKILKAEPSKNIKVAHEIEKLQRERAKAELHHGINSVQEYYSGFKRVYGGMLMPEISDEARRYNEQLQKKALTPEGQEEIIREAARLIIDADLNMISSDNSQNILNYRDNFRTYRLMFLADNIKTGLKDMQEKGKMTADASLVVDFEKVRLAVSIAGNIQNYANYLLDPMTSLLPENLKMTPELTAKVTGPDYWSKDVPDEDKRTLKSFLGKASTPYSLNLIFMAKINQDEVKEEFRISKKFTDEEVVLDEKNKQVPRDASLEFGKNYTVVSRNGEMRCIHLEVTAADLKKAKIEYSKAQIPDAFLRGSKEICARARQYLGDSGFMAEKINSVYGKKLSPEPMFKEIAQELKDCDYELPEGVSEEVGECIAVGSLLTPEVAEKVKNSSTIAGDTSQNRIDAMAIDWLAANDNRIKGADVQLKNIRNNMTDMMKNLKSDEAKKAFANAADVFGRSFMESNYGLGGTNAKSIFCLEMCEKLAKVIRENPDGIAESVSPAAKNAVLMKANMSVIIKNGAKATVELFTNPDLSPEEKKACLKQVVIANTVKKLLDAHAYKDKVDVTEEIADRLEMDADDLSDDFNAAISKSNNVLKAKKHFLNQTAFERALAGKPEELTKNIEAALPEGEINKLAEIPSLMYAEAIDNLSANPAVIVIPETDAPNVEGQFEAEKMPVVDALEKDIRYYIRNADKIADSDVINGKSDAVAYCGEMIDRMEEELNRTGAGILGASEEFKAVKKALAELKEVHGEKEEDDILKLGPESALMKRVLYYGNQYLEKKQKAGVDINTKGTAGDRYRNMIKSMKIAERFIKIADDRNDYCSRAPHLARYDVRTNKDFVKALELRENLLQVRNAIDDADPFFYKSSKLFKNIQGTLDDCIKFLKDYTRKGNISFTDSVAFTAKLSALEARTNEYLLKNDNPATDIGWDRFKAIRLLNKCVHDKSYEMSERDNARRIAREALRQNVAENERQKEAEELEKAARNNDAARYEQKSRAYEFVTMRSRSYDKNHVVSNLVYRVRLNNVFLKDIIKIANLHPSRIPEAKTLLEDRVLLDMIAKERELHKNEPVFEKVYINNPKQLKAKIFAPDSKLSNLMDKLFETKSKLSYAEVLDRLEVAAADNMERERNEIHVDNAPKNDKVKNVDVQKENEMAFI